MWSAMHCERSWSPKQKTGSGQACGDGGREKASRRSGSVPLARGAATGLGGACESPPDRIGAGGAPGERATRPPFWRRRVGAADGETVRDGIHAAAPRTTERIVRKDSRPLCPIQDRLWIGLFRVRIADSHPVPNTGVTNTPIHHVDLRFGSSLPSHRFRVLTISYTFLLHACYHS